MDISSVFLEGVCLATLVFFFQSRGYAWHSLLVSMVVLTSGIIFLALGVVTEPILDNAPFTADPWDVDGPCQEYVEVCFQFLLIY